MCPLCTSLLFITGLLCIQCVYICCFFTGLLCIQCVYLCCFKDCCVSSVFIFVFFTRLQDCCISSVFIFFASQDFCVSSVYILVVVLQDCCVSSCFLQDFQCVYICCFLQDCCVSTVYIQHVTPNQAPEQLMAKNLDTGEFCRVDLIGFTTPYSRGQITKADLSEV